MANKLYEEADIQAIANAIRQKNGSATRYTVSEMGGAILLIPTGSSGTDTSDATVSFWSSGSNNYSADIVSGKTAYAKGKKVTGNLKNYGGAHFSPNAYRLNQAGTELEVLCGSDEPYYVPFGNDCIADIPLSGLWDVLPQLTDSETEPLFECGSIGLRDTYLNVPFRANDNGVVQELDVLTGLKIPNSELERVGLFQWNKVYDGEVTANTTSTTATSLTNITIAGLYNAERVLVRITDKAGQRPGYFYQHEDYFRNFRREQGSTTSLTYGGRLGLYVNDDGQIMEYVGATTTAYGVYAYSISNSNVLNIRTRYNSSYSLTINGTFKVEVFTYSTPA